MKSNVRIILYALAAGLIFMLWQKWQTQNTALTESPTLVQQVDQQSSNTDVVQTVSSHSQSSQNQIVTIYTDLMTMNVKLRGAEVVKTSLNKYKQAIDKPDSFELLHTQEPAKMLFQSAFLSGKDTALMSNADWRTPQTSYEMNGQEELRVPFAWTSPEGVVYSKTFIFKKGKYQFTIEQAVDNKSNQVWKGSLYNQILFGKTPEVSGIGHVASFTGAVISTPKDTYQKVSLSDIASNNKVDYPTDKGWVAMMQHYFIAALVPQQVSQMTFFTNYGSVQGNHIVGLKSQEKTAAVQKKIQFDPVVAYFGPKIAKNLQEIKPILIENDKEYTFNLDKTVDYGYLFMISEFMFKVMAFIHDFVGNWGWSIIIMTLLIKLLFFLPSAWAYKSMAKMRGLQPEMTRIREQYKGERAQMSQEVMKLYRREKVNPASGCLPMILQIPFFIAFYWVLAESVQLRQAPWFGWIQDLSTMDPYYILPIINGSLMFLQQKLNPPPPDPTQAKIMMMLPLVFGFMFMWFPSGLVLYWTVSNGFSIIQQYIMNKKYGGPLRAHNHKK